MTPPTPEQPDVPPTKEQSHRLFYQAFHDWFMSEDNGCDFWSECDAPEQLATIAVEIADQDRATTRARMLEALREPSDELLIAAGAAIKRATGPGEKQRAALRAIYDMLEKL